MHSDLVRNQALTLLESGQSLSDVSRDLGVSRAALREWHHGKPRRMQPHGCPRCSDIALDTSAYSALLGYYLGDGHISPVRSYYALRISCDSALPGIVDDVEATIHAVRPSGKVFRVSAPGTQVVHSNWKHWPCLFPQHGPGRKHMRAIVLHDWQCDIVLEHPAEFLRGLFHSDGSRVKNWATRVVAGQMKRYDYPRWQFTNYSADIRELCCRALDLVGVSWRASSPVHISVSTRSGVARLDELIGLKL